MNAKLLVLLVSFATVFAYEDVTLVEYVNSHSYMFFENLIKQAGLTEVLSQTGPYTLFVPTDDAFAKLGQDVIDQYSSSQLKSIIRYHVVESYVLVPMVSSRQNYSTLLGEPVTIEITAMTPRSVILNGVATVDGAHADNIVNNGVVQPIDTVLMPPDAYLTGETLAQLLILGDDKFKDILLAFMMADMINLLEHNEFTVFAPTDSAFESHRAQILRPEGPDAQQRHQEVLKYHIVPGARRVSDLTDGQKLFTLNGNPLTVLRNSTGVFINNAKVVDSDIFASNGFLHSIDDFLIPPHLLDEIDN